MAKGELSAKERMFVTAFMGAAKGNATRAARLAGYGKNDHTASTLGARLLGKVGVKAAIAERQAQAEQSSILTNDEIDRRLTELSLGEDGFVALGAVREMNKCRGRHSSTLRIQSLEDAIIATEAPEKK